MGRCRCAASKCVQCLVAHVPPFPRVFQGLLDKKFDTLSWWHKFLVDDPLIEKKNLGIGRVCSVPLPTEITQKNY